MPGLIFAAVYAAVVIGVFVLFLLPLINAHADQVERRQNGEVSE